MFTLTCPPFQDYYPAVTAAHRVLRVALSTEHVMAITAGGRLLAAGKNNSLCAFPHQVLHVCGMLTLNLNPNAKNRQPDPNPNPPKP